MPLPPGPTFRSVYCSRVNLPPERFHRSVFWACVPPRKKIFVAALRVIRPQLFGLDIELVDAASNATSLAGFDNEVALHYGSVRERSWLRDKLKLRMSLHRLRKLAAQYLPKT